MSRIFIYNQAVAARDCARLKTMLADADYAALEKAVALADAERLAADWPSLTAMNKLVLFKLMDAPRAMDFYGRLPFEEQYFLLCGFPLAAIAPVLEDLAPAERRRFVSLPREFYDRMFRQLASSRPALAGARRD